MSKSTLDKRLKELLDDHWENLKKDNDKDIIQHIPGVFLFGIFTGIVLAFSGLLGILIGFTIGVITAKYSVGIIDKIVNYMSYNVGEYIHIKK